MNRPKSRSYLGLYLREIGVYSLLTIEDEKFYSGIVRSVVRKNPLIKMALNTLLVDKNVLKKTKIALGLEGGDLEALVEKAKEYLEPFHNPWMDDKETLERWLTNRDRQTFEGFEGFKKYDAARRVMITANLRLAVDLANRFTNKKKPIEDLIQTANIGLEKAVLRYDSSFGTKFSTYATNWIKAELGRLSKDFGLIRLPKGTFYEYISLIKIRDKFCNENGILPSETELLERAVENGVSIKHAKRILPFIGDIFPNGSSQDYIKYVEGNEMDPLDRIQVNERVSLVSRLIDGLDPRETKIVKMYHFIGEYRSEDDTTPRKLREIGALFGISTERVRQILFSASEKMKIAAKAEGFPDCF